MSTYRPGYIEGKVKAGFYLAPDVQKALRIRSAETGEGMSDIAERALRNELETDNKQNDLEVVAVNILRTHAPYLDHPITAQFVEKIVSDPEFCGDIDKPENIFDTEALDAFRAEGWTADGFPEGYTTPHGQEKWDKLVDEAVRYLAFSVVAYRAEKRSPEELARSLVKFHELILNAHAAQIEYDHGYRK